MQTENKEIIKDLLSRNWKYVVLFIVIVYAYNRCVNSAPTISTASKEIIEKDSIINSLNNQIADIQNQKAELEKKRSVDQLENKRLKESLNSISQKYKSKKTEIKTFSNNEIALFYYDRYFLNESKTTPFGVELSTNLARINIEDLTDCDETREKYDTLNNLLKNTEKQLANCDAVSELSKAEIKALEQKNKLSEDKFNIANDELAKEKEANSKEVKFRLLLGGGGGIDRGLSQPVYKLNAGFQTRNGNVYTSSYQRIGVIDYILGEVNFSIFSIKGKKK